MERKVKKKYIHPEIEVLEAEMHQLCLSVNSDPEHPADPEDELSRKSGFSDFEESDYDY